MLLSASGQSTVHTCVSMKSVTSSETALAISQTIYCLNVAGVCEISGPVTCNLRVWLVKVFFLCFVLGVCI